MGSVLIRASWPAPAGVIAWSTTRHGGVSAEPWHSLNLGDHVGDDPSAVTINRSRLLASLPAGAQIAWLTQVHGTSVVQASKQAMAIEADAHWTQEPGLFCAIMTADCLPVLFCDRAGSVVAAAHAGWRGLVNGILEATVRALPSAPENLLAWLGPAIGPASFEVGDMVRDQALHAVPNHRRESVQACFLPAGRCGHWYADLYGLAQERLQALALAGVYGTVRDTFSEADDFFSYRRDGVTGRMATLIGLGSEFR